MWRTNKTTKSATPHPVRAEVREAPRSVGRYARHALILAPLLLGACSTLEVSSAKSPTSAFAAYRTYAHGGPERSPAGFDRTVFTPEVWAKVQSDIDEELAQKGYTPAIAGQPPDFMVRSGSGARTVEKDKAAVVHENADAPVSADVVEHTRAKLVIDVFDVRTLRPVWQGTSERGIDAPSAGDQPIAEAVHAVLRSFPRAADAPVALRDDGRWATPGSPAPTVMRGR